MYQSALKMLIFASTVLMAASACGRSPDTPLAGQAIATATAPLTTAPTSYPSVTPSPVPTYSAYDRFLAKPAGLTLRLMTYNVGWDSIFPPDDPQNHDLRVASRGEAFTRIMRAVEPDIVCLQEINERRSEPELTAFIEQLVGPGGGSSWNIVHVRDTLIATRLTLIEQGYELDTRTVLPNLDQAAALVDLPDETFGDQDLYVICAHFKAGGGLGDILLRVRQADAIMAHLRDFRSLSGGAGLSEGTPFVIMGDFNIYDTDPARQLQTLRRGDISDQGRYGPDWLPDWDGTRLLDARPSHNGLGGDFYTWREDASPFNPRALDRIIYSDSVLSLENAFVLNTQLMTDEILALHGLQRADVMLDPASGYYDHLPVVVDFFLQGSE